MGCGRIDKNMTIQIEVRVSGRIIKVDPFKVFNSNEIKKEGARYKIDRLEICPIFNEDEVRLIEQGGRFVWLDQQGLIKV